MSDKKRIKQLLLQIESLEEQILSLEDWADKQTIDFNNLEQLVLNLIKIMRERYPA